MNSLPEIGDVVDDTYELVSILGTGGFGAVYRARQLNMDRDVALKLLVASGPKFEEMVKRFRREVMAIRNLTHPNTVRIYDFRDNPEGLLYYTMEALDGVTLKDEVRQKGPMSPRRLQRVMVQVLKSLSEAHAHNIVHRDLKPANIMLVDMHGEEDFVKVLDFGIAKLLHDDEDIEELTSAGILVGTIRYMAPEQIAGAGVGAHTDLYALGLIAVEMLTGRSVFAGTGRWEVLQQQISKEPVDIPSVVLESALGPIVARCLQKKPEQRYANADELIADLKNLEQGQIEDEPLFVSDGGQGWRPQGAPESGAAIQEGSDLDAMNTVMIEEEIDDRTEVSEERPFPEDFEDKTIVTESGVQDTGEIVSPQPVEENRDRSDAADQQMAPTGEQFISGQFVALEESEKSKGPLIAIVALVLLLGCGAAAWMVLNPGSETEDEQESAAALGQSEQDRAGDDDDRREEVAQAQGAAEADEAEPNDEESESREVLVELENSGLRATVYRDDELMGRTPYRVTLRDGEAANLRLEARDHEVLETVVDWDSEQRVSLELQPSADDEEESDSPRAGGRQPASTGDDDEPEEAASGASAGQSGSSSASAEVDDEPAPTQDSEPEAPEAPAADEGSEDGGDDDPWVDISRDDDEPAADSDDSGGSDWVELESGDDEEEEEEERDIPLF